jgi:hypothetical protein
LKIRSAGSYIVVDMPNRALSRALLSIIFAFWTTAGLYPLTIVVGGSGYCAVGAGQGFGPKLQYGGGGAADLLFPVLPWLDLGAGLEISDVLASDDAGGFIYAGFFGTAVTFDATVSTELGSWSGVGSLRAGAGIDLGAFFARYSLTTLYFFSPVVGVAGYVEYLPSFLPGWSIRIGPSFAALFRRDMDYWLRPGIDVSFVYMKAGQQ